MKTKKEKERKKGRKTHTHTQKTKNKIGSARAPHDVTAIHECSLQAEMVDIEKTEKGPVDT